MSTYLYTWNPKRWTWSSQRDAVERVQNGDTYDTDWSCGKKRTIEIGDVFLLMRLGVDPKGLIDCGRISSGPRLSPHWDKTRASEGKTVLKTDVSFEILA